MTRLEWFVQQALKPMQNGRPVRLEGNDRRLPGFVLTEHSSKGRWKDRMGGQRGHAVTTITDWPKTEGSHSSVSLAQVINRVGEWIDVD